MIKGIDVSSYQGDDFGLSGLDFVVVKASEGTSVTNKLHAAQVKRARGAGLVVGHYHWLSTPPPSTMKAQMDYFLDHADAQEDEFLAVDWEEEGVSGAMKDQAVKYLKSKAGGRKVLLYCNKDFWTRLDTTSYAGDGLWIARYGVAAGKPGIEHSWVIHQWTDSGGKLDKNVAGFDSRAAMAKWAGGKPASKPKVSLAKVVEAARKDPKLPQGGTTHKAHVVVVERALRAEGLLEAEWVDGSFGSRTVDAYKKWQRKLGYSGKDADGIPGKTSLTKLGNEHGFTTTA